VRLSSRVFRGGTAQTRREARAGFADAFRDAGQLLRSDDAIRESLRETMGAAENDALLATLRDDCRRSISRATTPEPSRPRPSSVR
jgi:hypothetical protein